MGTVSENPFEAVEAARALSHSAENYANDEKIEVAWAIQAYDHAEIHFDRWRSFCEEYKGKVEDYNFGTLLRINCKEGYNDKNTIFAWRVQFLAIEIARNREGYNTPIFLKARQESRKTTD